MELRRLRYFCAVAEERHLTRAADRLGIRATSLSQQIIALERELDRALFTRTAAGMEPTSAGLALLPAARAVLAAAERARVAVAATAAPLRVAVTPGAPTWSIPALYAAVRGKGALLEPVDLQTAPALAALERGEVDAALIVLPEPSGEWSVQVLSDVPLGVVVSTNHRLAQQSVVDWPDLDGSELLWLPREFAPGYHDAILAHCRQLGWVPAAVRARAPRRGLFTAELASGDDLVALRPEDDIAPSAGLVWRPLSAAAPRLRHAIVWSARHPRAKLLADLAREVAALTPEAPPRGRAGGPDALLEPPTPTGWRP